MKGAPQPSGNVSKQERENRGEIQPGTQAASYPFDFLFLCVPQAEVEHPEVFAVDDELLGVFLQLSKERLLLLIKHCAGDKSGRDMTS